LQLFFFIILTGNPRGLPAKYQASHYAYQKLFDEYSKLIRTIHSKTQTQKSCSAIYISSFMIIRVRPPITKICERRNKGKGKYR